MSETEHKRGKLELVEIKVSLEDTCKGILEVTGLPDYFDNYSEFLCDEKYDEYFVINDVLYKVIEEEAISPDNEILQASRNDDNTINFEVRWYNGGASMSEVLGQAIMKMDKP